MAEHARITQPPIGVIVVGYGAIGRRHAEVIGALPGAAVRAVVDPDGDARAAAEQQGLIAHPTLTEALATVGPAEAAAVAVCSPNGLHAEHAEQALAAGRHVVIEKPLATLPADAERVIHAAARADRLATVVVQNRLTPAMQWLKALVEQGTLGRPLVVQITCLWNRDDRYYAASPWRGDAQLDAGVLFTQFSHFIDLLVWLWGEPTPLAATLRNLTHPSLPLADSGTATLALPGGGLAAVTFTTSAAGSSAENRIAIAAERGSVVIGGQYFDRVESALLPEGAVPHFAAESDRLAGHRAVWQQALAAIAAGPPYPSTLADGAAVVRVIDGIHRCALQPEPLLPRRV